MVWVYSLGEEYMFSMYKNLNFIFNIENKNNE